MKHLSLIALALIGIAFASCNGNKTSSAGNVSTAANVSDTTNDSTFTDSTATPPPSQEVVEELNKAVKENHDDADANFSYDEKTNTVKIVKIVEIPAGKSEDDYAGIIAEKDVPEFIKQFKKSTNPNDVTIKTKGASITISYVNKATGEEITQAFITPEDLK